MTVMLGIRTVLVRASFAAAISLLVWPTQFSRAMQGTMPQADGVPRWCKQSDRRCTNQRRKICTGQWSKGPSLLLCMRGTKDAPGTQNGTTGGQSSTNRRPIVNDNRSPRTSSADRTRPVRDNRRRDPILNRTDRRSLDNCVDAILLGPEIKKLKIRGHEFNCKPPKSFRKLGNIWIFKGQLSHHLSRRRDDQFNYSFSIAPDGSISDFDVDIKRGGLFPTINRVAPLNFINERLDPGYWTASTFSRVAGKAFEGTWQDVAGMVLVNTSNRLAFSMKETRRRLPYRGSAMYYYVDIPGKDIRRVDLPANVASPKMCQRQCNNESACKAWTFSRPYPSSGNARCWLKSDAPPTKVAKGAVSGRSNRRGR